jgi:LmbE family N-acetylglucosaminyl deacetylase
MALMASTFPILPGKTDDWRRFIAELKGARRSEYEASRKALGVHERSFFQPTPMGDFVIVTLEGDNPGAAFAKFASSTDPFSAWFLAQVKELHGFELADVLRGPMPELAVDSAP